jgi:hypothetical protein
MNVWGNVKKLSLGGLVAGGLIIVSSFSVTGCLTDDKKEEDTTKTTDTTTVKKDTVTTKSVTVGAQANNDLGSFIDLDTYTVLKQSAAEAASGTVDLVFAFSGSASSSAVYSPDAAKAGIAGGPGLDIAADLTTANVTELRTIDAAKYDAVKTKEGLDSLFNAGTPASPAGRLLVSNGFAFGAKTAGGKIVGMKITAVTTSTTGQATIQGKAKF